MKTPRLGSEAKAWTEVKTPERTRKVPLLERPDVNRNNFQNNCHGLTDSFADEKRPSNLKRLAREIRTEGLDASERPNTSLQGTPAGGRP